MMRYTQFDGASKKMNEENFTPVEQPILEPKKNNIVMIVIIIVIVAITAGVIGFLFAKKTQAPATESVAVQPVAQTPTTQTPVTQPADETADWQMYTDDKYGFEIKYPQDMKVKSKDDGIVLVYAEYRNDLPEGGWGFNVSISEDSLDEYIKNYEKTDGISKIVPQGEYVLNGVKAKKMIAKTAIGIDNSVIFVNKNNKSYIISYLESYEEHLKILSTFKFTDVVVDETEDWKTYKNTKNDFEIKYPLGWKIDQPNVNQVSFYSENHKNDYYFSITVVKNLKKSLNVWAKFNLEDENIESQSASVVGIEALKFTSLPSTQAPGNIHYYFIKNNDGYILNTTYMDTSNGIGEKILSTFKFTK